MNSRDESYMTLALRLARRGLGQTWPNPAVGAVIVREGEGGGEVLARGWTMPGGRPHAETVALERAGDKARGGTIYVTLEPCSHHGRTPPCADAIIAAGIARVVCAMDDPDPRVSGEGFARLRSAGIAVDTGVLESEAQRVARGHVLRVTQERPEITLKLAVGADGLIAPGDGAPVWVTGEEARARAHLLRARSDAILVGSGTLAADDPDLTCRLPGMEHRSPVRVVLDGDLDHLPEAKMLKTAEQVPVWAFCGDAAPISTQEALAAKGALVMEVETNEAGKLQISALIARLAEKGITRLLVEGGPSVARSFLDADVVDRVIIFRGSKAAGEGALQPFGDAGLERIDQKELFRLEDTRPVGADMMLVYERQTK